MLLIDKKGRKYTAITASSIIICMVFFAALFDNWYIRMVCLGIANGCEGCFSNLFNLIMNESSRKKLLFFANFVVPKTTIRSRMVGLCLVSYSLGCISLNLLSLLFTDADSLMVMLTALIIFAVLPNFFVLLESPMYLYKSGYVVGTINTLREIAYRNNRKIGYKYFERQL